jgi:hypothetical protein
MVIQQVYSWSLNYWSVQLEKKKLALNHAWFFSSIISISGETLLSLFDGKWDFILTAYDLPDVIIIFLNHIQVDYIYVSDVLQFLNVLWCPHRPYLWQYKHKQLNLYVHIFLSFIPITSDFVQILLIFHYSCIFFWSQAYADARDDD